MFRLLHPGCKLVISYCHMLLRPLAWDCTPDRNCGCLAGCWSVQHTFALCHARMAVLALLLWLLR
jgi:hypothetical protein